MASKRWRETSSRPAAVATGTQGANESGTQIQLDACRAAL